MLVSAWRRNVQSWLTRTSRPRARSEQPSESTAPPGTALRLAAFARAMPWLACSMVDTTPPEKNGNTFVPPSFKWIVAGFNLPAAISLGIIGSDFELAPCTAMIIPTNSASAKNPTRARIPQPPTRLLGRHPSSGPSPYFSEPAGPPTGNAHAEALHAPVTARHDSPRRDQGKASRRERLSGRFVPTPPPGARDSSDMHPR